MEKVANAQSHKQLTLNTIAFTVCFAAWMMNGVLVTFLAANGVFDWGPVEIGWLMDRKNLKFYIQRFGDTAH